MKKHVKKLTHRNIVDLVRLFVPVLPDAGVCNGFTSMWAQAYITGDKQEKDFYLRLDNISKNVLLYKNKDKYNGKINTIEMRAFSEGIAIQQEPEILGIFDNNYIDECLKHKLFPLTASVDLAKKIINTDIIGIATLTCSELTNYLICLEQILLDHQRSVFLLCSDEHAIGIYFNTTSKKWHFIDIEKLSGKKHYYYEVDAKKLAPLIFHSLLDHTHAYTTFSLACISTDLSPLEIKALKIPAQHYLYHTVQRKNIRATTALHLAARLGETQIVNQIINDKNFTLNIIEAKDCAGFTALMMASQPAHTEVLKALLAKGANVNAQGPYQYTALMMAAASGHSEIIEILLSNHADIHAKDSDGKTALTIATEKGHTQIIQRLTEIHPLHKTSLLLFSELCHPQPNANINTDTDTDKSENRLPPKKKQRIF